MKIPPPRQLRVSFSGPDGQTLLSIITPSADGGDEQPRNSQDGTEGPVAEEPAENPVVLIDPERISEFWRFRLLFVALILMVNSSTQGVYALYGLYLEELHHFDARAMADIYAAGTAFGLFVFPFAVMYDFLGPKPVIATAAVLTALSHLLFALTFGGHITGSKTLYCIFFAMMNWGCYAFDVAVLPAIVTHMPRNRARPIALVKTFSGLGPSVISCMFRGFFNNHFDHLMYFIMALVIVTSIVGVLCLNNAPYEAPRIRKRHMKLTDSLHLYLIRNRYMSQLLPMRRLDILGGIMVLLNVYLTVQAICVAYYRDSVTIGTYRGLAIGALIIVSMISVLLMPLKFLDNATAQDPVVVNKARQKEHELAERRRKRALLPQGPRGNVLEVSHPPFGATPSSPNKGNLQDAASESSETESLSTVMVTPGAGDGTGGTAEERSSSGKLTAYEEAPEGQMKPLDPDVSLVTVSSNWLGGMMNEEGGEAERIANSSIFRTDILSGHVSRETTEGMKVVTRQHSTYDNPHIETITVCGEIFVTPVYETTFLESLTYMDIWLLFFTTLVVWGIGITLTANLNIKTMVATRYTSLEYKTYVLIAAFSGVWTASGRVIIAIYDDYLPRINERFGLTLASTVALPLPSILLTVAMILYLALPGNLSLIVVYIIAPFGFGFSTSMTFFVVSVIFKHDIGMHYGFCFTGAAIGIALLYRTLFFEVYDHHKLVLPPDVPIDTRGACVGDACMRTTLIVYLVLSVTSIATSYLVHYRYWKLVHGKLKYHRVTAQIRDHLRQRSKKAQGQ